MTIRRLWRRSIAQGCSEYNITVLIDQKDSVRALRAVHGRFYLATLPLGVGLVGPGLIGGTFLDQIHQQMTVRCLHCVMQDMRTVLHTHAILQVPDRCLLC